MCGIVGAIAQRHVSPILLQGLQKLEYRGYDSAGMAIIDPELGLRRERVCGKVSNLARHLQDHPLRGQCGLAHTRWATHGKPTVANAHPHISADKRLALVHNGIIENHQVLREQLALQGYVFTSQTDTEVLVNQIHFIMHAEGCDAFSALQQTLNQVQGAYAIALIDAQTPDRLLVARHGSPLVIGLGIEEHFVASDISALQAVTQRFIYLEEGDRAIIETTCLQIVDAEGRPCERREKISAYSPQAIDKGKYRHFMLKEIYEQPDAIARTIQGRVSNDHVLAAFLGEGVEQKLQAVKAIQIIACGTSYHAALVARYWFEALVSIPCQVEIASEFRYRQVVIIDQTLLICISQSGETADTLAALKQIKQQYPVQTLAICNAPESSLVRESDLVFLTHAGPEIGVASTKAFTTQLVALLLLVCLLAQFRNIRVPEQHKPIQVLQHLPDLMRQILRLDTQIAQLAEVLIDKHHCLFLGRGTQYPIAMEGALKLKEISYIHAEAYAAGELKHGPIALIDEDMPVIAVAPDNELLGKLRANLEEVHARGGQLIVFADQAVEIKQAEGIRVIRLPVVDDWIAPIAFSLPLQLLAYYVAVLRGTDVDQPRNLAKSVTVE